MIEITRDPERAVLELSARGTVRSADYQDVLVPAVEEALAEWGRIRLLARFGPDFERYDLGAVIDDAKLGLRHWRGFERVAVVTDVGWLRHLVGGIGFLMPCPVQVFRDARLEDARRWLRESLGSIRLDFDDAADTVTVRLLGKLEPSAYSGVDAELDRWLSGRDRMRLLLDLREFDGWQGLGALGEHLGIVREYARRPERVAIVGDAAWQRLAAGVMGRFVRAEVCYFPSGSFEEASAWVRG